MATPQETIINLANLSRFKENLDPVIGAKQNVLTAGTGIVLASDEVSVDTAVVALKSELFSNPMTASNDLIVGGTSGAPTRLAKGNNGELLRVNASGNIAYGKNLPIVTTAPSADNTDGLIICVLDSDPAQKFNGFLYIIS